MQQYRNELFGRRWTVYLATVASGWFIGGAVLPTSCAAAAAEDVNPVVQMVVDLLRDKDRDMRALGLQQVRGEVKGTEATNKFAALLPELPPETQAGLAEALGERADPVARPAVLKLVTSPEPGVRAAALGALGTLGQVVDVQLLAKHTAGGSDRETAAARQALTRLRGEGVDPAILAALPEAPPAGKTQLLGVLAERNAKQALPQMFAATRDQDAAVRLAALHALRMLAEERDTAGLVAVLKAAAGDTERREAEVALLAVCNRGRQACVAALVAGLAEADVPARMTLLHALGRAGGPQALAAVVQRIRTEEPVVRDEAVRMLSSWNDPAAVPPLLALAETAQNARHQLLAVRGLVRLASPVGERPADLKTLGQALALAKRPEEKRLALSALANVPTVASLNIVVPLLDDPALAEDAALAVVTIAEKMPQETRSQAKAALQKAAGRAQSLRERIERLVPPR
jgi:HEAT repeat protein